jgi:hypothetical protein
MGRPSVIDASRFNVQHEEVARHANYIPKNHIYVLRSEFQDPQKITGGVLKDNGPSPSIGLPSIFV